MGHKMANKAARRTGASRFAERPIERHRRLDPIADLNAKPHRMSDHLLTFELAKDSKELFIHADAAGLRYLAAALTRLAHDAEAGRKEHTHLMTEDWSGHELSSVAQGSAGCLLHRVTIHGWPKKEGARDVVA
ncbi:MAG: hypothetical protein RIS76_4429 [Verrucomicrobiota bacterium]